MIAAFVAILALLAGSQSSQAQQNPVNCQPQSNVGMAVFCVNNGVTNSVTGQTLIIGETVIYQARVSQSADGDCAVEGGQLDITLPNNTTVNATQGQTIPLICGSAGCNPGGIQTFFSQFVSYTVAAGDVGTSRSGVTPCSPSPAGRVQAKATYTGGISHCDANNSCDPSSSISSCNPVLARGLQVTKLVTCTTGTVCDATLSYSSSASGAKIGATNPKFCYSVLVTNSGTAPLIVDSVNDNQLGDVTAQFPGGLAAGGSALVFLGPSEESSTTVNTLTVAAHEAVSCQQLTTNASSTATANVIDSGITCEVRFVRNAGQLTGKVGECSDCDVTVNPTANGITVIVRVTNPAGSGQNIVNGSIKVGANTFLVFGPITPGNSVDTQVDTIAANTTTACQSYTADVTFDGATTGSCPPITTTCNSSIRVCGTPNVCIIKLVKCMTSVGEGGECLSQTCSSDLSLYSPTATGVEDAGFCYGIVINNCGQIDLTGVVVNDSQLGNGLAGFPTTLAVGQSATNFYPKSYPGQSGTIRNTATVTGQSAGGQVSATSNAVVTILSPSINCTKTVSLNGGAASAGGTVEVPFGSTNSLTFAVIVRNNGNVDLVNVQVIDAGTSGCPVSTNVIASLPVGASVTNVLCTIEGASCPPTTSITNHVDVSADVSSEVCSINPENCQRITTSSSCENIITLTCTPPGACRTTGGGKQPTEDTCPEVRYVTHGGQVGASFGVAGAPDCATDTGFNNPCIRGEYQHVRHIKGGLRGTFHAAGNGNEHNFDSLMCACLPCDHTDTASPFGGCHPADRCYTEDGLLNGLCHPGQRECGPEPRRAPANKICFSGVADYTMNQGKKAPQSVVFRVDLEDRSEPGGAHPKGGTPPPDRYRMRMWFIQAGATDNRFSGAPDSANNKALRATVSCKDATCEIIPATLDCVGGSTPAPNIDDGGDLDRGNRQIHPSTGASCH